MSRTLWRLSASSFVGFFLFLGDASAQTPCTTVTRSDFTNFTYSPTRASSLRNGLFSVHVEEDLLSDSHDRETISRAFTVRRSDEQLTATATIDIVDALADIETYFFSGGGEAGIELNLRVLDASGAVKCTDREELYVARFIEDGHPTGRRVLSCNFNRTADGDTDTFTVSVEAHAWVVIGGFTSAVADLDAQIVNYSLRGCSGSCSGSCGGASSNGTCFCDDACTGFGDCCADYAPLCAQDSCWERCGGVASGCYCDTACTSYGDCCDDHADSCL